MQTAYPKWPAHSSYVPVTVPTAPLKSELGKVLHFPGINTKSKIFTIRPKAEYQLLEKKAAAAKRDFVISLANDAQAAAQLRAAGITPAQIAEMKFGRRPKGFDVHHLNPLKFGGDNSRSNFILMQTEEIGANYHGALTNYQNRVHRNLPDGTLFEIEWPEFGGVIYPS